MANITPSLANMTGTRTDSASKHIRVCRVGQDYICNWIGKSFEQLKANKLQHAVQKDDFFIACGRPLFDSNGAYNNMKPYPVGLGNLHELAPHAHKFIAFMNHVCVTRRDMTRFLKRMNDFFLKFDRNADQALRAIAGMPDFYMSGVALTTAFPHGHIGDTALSVLTGGMMTVLNGPFMINAGDPVTWIWDFERDNFTETGQRKEMATGETRKKLLKLFGSTFLDATEEQALRVFIPDDAEWNTFKNASESTVESFKQELDTYNSGVARHDLEAPDAKRRKFFNDSQYRVVNGNPSCKHNEGRHGAMPILIPMPVNPSYADCRRAFGKCMMSARPYDRTDIMIGRQGL